MPPRRLHQRPSRRRSSRQPRRRRHHHRPDGRKIVIQCKRYGPTTNTCYYAHSAQTATVVTTSVFTQPAVGYARQHGIRLCDATALGAQASRTGPAPWM
ncbi:restriction endonuclease [Streptomyces sp. NPDC059460]|uniref:restriction endonuclease n=1 Tax=Streptomyces sp. NPDC059460 TaxID=3346840 RepID=UPI0036A51238